MAYTIQTANEKVRELHELLIKAGNLAEEVAENYPWLNRQAMGSLTSRLTDYRDNKDFHGDTQRGYSRYMLSKDLTYPRFLNEFVGAYLKGQEHGLGYNLTEEAFTKEFFAWDNSFGITWEQFASDLKAKLKDISDTRLRRSELRKKLGIDRMDPDFQYARIRLRARFDAYKKLKEVTAHSEGIYLGFLRDSSVSSYYESYWKAKDLPKAEERGCQVRFIRWRGFLINVLEREIGWGKDKSKVRKFQVLAPVTTKDFREFDGETLDIHRMTDENLFEVEGRYNRRWAKSYFKIIHEVDSGARWNLNLLQELLADINRNYDTWAGSHEREIIDLLNAGLQDNPNLEFKRQELHAKLFEAKYNMVYHVSPGERGVYSKIFFERPRFETRIEFEDRLYSAGLRAEEATQLAGVYTGLMNLTTTQSVGGY